MYELIGEILIIAAWIATILSGLAIPLVVWRIIQESKKNA
jgi:hypothetical protein